MKIGSAFPSKFLKADDIGSKTPVVTIDKLTVEEIQGEEKPKPVVYFKGSEKGLVLNVTNSNSITAIAGSDETDNWPGVKVRLFTCKVDFQGKRVNAIRIADPKEILQPPPSPAEDEVPF